MTPKQVAELHAKVFPDCPMAVLAAKLCEEAGEVSKETVLQWEDIVSPPLLDRSTSATTLAEVEDVLTVCMVLVARCGGDWNGSVSSAAARFVGRFG